MQYHPLRTSQRLDSGWRFIDTAPQGGEPMPPPADAPWMPATVPGDIHIDLVAAGRVEDPFYGENCKQSLFAEDREWWYQTTVVPGPALANADRIELVFEGLDTFATVFLNGEEVASARNMWIPLRVDVTSTLRRGEANELLVRFQMPKQAVADRVARMEETPGVNPLFSPPERVFSRKAQMSFGWDIAPRIVTCGIWRPVRLEGLRVGALRDVHARTAIRDDGSALLCFTVAAEAFQRIESWAVDVSGHCDGSTFQTSGRLVETDGEPAGRIEVALPSPRLWWTANAGPQNLYDVTVTLRAGEATIDSTTMRLGVRSIELVQTDPDTGDARFFFRLNGRDTFICGTNWIPVDALFARVDRERLASVLDLALELNCNMLRIWGGGIYEQPAFYELCDELGLLVWHDFMYACALYPQDEEFLAEARAEAEAVVRRLRSHACVALWAGDNEIDWAYEWTGDLTRCSTNRINREVLPEVVARLDPDRPYIPSSPFNPSGTGSPNSPDEGDVHLWSHTAHPRDDLYFADRSRFISEIGRICPPNVESIERFLPEDARWPHANPIWDQHLGTIPTQDFRRRDAMDQALVNITGAVPESLEGYVEASQLQQAFCLSEWIERARRRKFECGGILWWNLFDNWPQHSDAVVDYYFTRKHGFEAVRRASRPVMPSVCANAEDVCWELWVLNDTDDPVSGVLELRIRSLSGPGRLLLTKDVSAPPNASLRAATVPFETAGRLDASVEWLRCTLTAFGLLESTDHVLDGCRSMEVLRAAYGNNRT